MSMDMYEVRKRADRRFDELWREMQKHEAEWRACRDAFAPDRGRFDGEEGGAKLSGRRNSAPYDIADEFASGMQSGLASPARKWFSFGLMSSRMKTSERVKAYIGQCEEITESRLLQSNFYDQLLDFMKEQGVFGTAAMLIEDDADDIMFCKTLTAGEYAIGTDKRDRVDRICRKVRYTLLQLADDFGVDALPPMLREDLKDKDKGKDAIYIVRHLIEPNDDVSGETVAPRIFKCSSLWWLEGSREEPYFLRIGGYYEFPAVVGRWKTVSSDVYGSEYPGKLGLDDARTIQALETDSRGAIERSVKPPLLATSGLKSKINNSPNAITFYDQMGQGQLPPVQRLFALDFNYQAAEAKIDKLVMWLERTFKVDQFKMWSGNWTQGRTATEIESREEEKGSIIAALTIRQCAEVLTRLLTIVTSILARAHLMPPEMPEELKGQDMKIDYKSEFAQRMKRASLGGVQTVMQVVSTLAEMQAAAGGAPEVVDRLDADEIVEVVAGMFAIPTSIILGDDKVAAIREERSAQMQQAQQAAQMQQAAEAAPRVAGAMRDASQTVPAEGGDDALSVMSRLVGGGGGA